MVRPAGVRRALSAALAAGVLALVAWPAAVRAQPRAGRLAPPRRSDVWVPGPRLPDLDLDPGLIPPVPEPLGRRLSVEPLRGTRRRPATRLPPIPRLKRLAIGVVDPVVAELFSRQRRAAYTGDADCLLCHQEKAADERSSIWGLIVRDHSIPGERRGCEGCHGPGGEHAGDPRMITDPAKLDGRRQTAVCLSCHADRRLVKRLGWHLSEHSESHVRCTDCHRVHDAPVEKSLAAPVNKLCLGCHQDQAPAFAFLSRHPVQVERVGPLRSLRSGKVTCIDCHQVYTARQPRMLRDDRKALCVRCHQERAGPFLFEHLATDPGVSDGCQTCHVAHGSPNRQLLKVTSRGLCNTCHTDRIDHFPGLNCYVAACHRDVHGSNSNRLYLPF